MKIDDAVYVANVVRQADAIIIKWGDKTIQLNGELREVIDSAMKQFIIGLKDEDQKGR